MSHSAQRPRSLPSNGSRTSGQYMLQQLQRQHDIQPGTVFELLGAFRADGQRFLPPRPISRNKEQKMNCDLQAFTLADVAGWFATMVFRTQWPETLTETSSLIIIFCCPSWDCPLASMCACPIRGGRHSGYFAGAEKGRLDPDACVGSLRGNLSRNAQILLPGVLSPVFAADWQVLGVISEEALKLRKVASGTARGRALVCPGVKETVPLRRKDRIRVVCGCDRDICRHMDAQVSPGREPAAGGSRGGLSADRRATPRVTLQDRSSSRELGSRPSAELARRASPQAQSRLYSFYHLGCPTPKIP